MATKSAINTPNALDLRAIQAAISAARQRIEALEAALTSVAGLAGKTAYQGTGGASNATTAALQTQITNLSTDVTALEAVIDGLLALANGFVAVSAGALVSRALVAGDNITITNPTGAAGAPTISAGGGRGEFLLSENDDFLQTESGLHLVLE